MPNIFSDIPSEINQEIFHDLIKTKDLRIERIISHGQSSPAEGWYEQDEHEWVMVLRGQGVIEFAEGHVVTLNPGDHLNIAAGLKHKVVSTAADEVTVWLAVFYRGEFAAKA
jgi:cupin 2 domain-containing protein